MSKQNILAQQGDALTITVTGSFSGKTVILTAKTDKSISDSDASVVKKNLTIAGDNLSATASFTGTETAALSGTYYYQISSVTSGVLALLQNGVITFKKAVSVRTS